MSDLITNHQAIIAEYLESRELADTSRKTYRNIINIFFRFMVRTSRDARRPTPKDAIAFKLELEKENKSHFTISSYIVTLRAFFTWMVEAGYYNIIITKGLQRIRKQIKYAKLPLTRQQVNDLLASINTSTMIGQRDYLIISFALTTGLRVNEMANVQLTDINGNQIYVLRKGYYTKTQKIEIPDSLLPMIENYINARLATGQEVNDMSYLFVSHTSCRSGNMQAKRLSEIIKARLIKAGMYDKRYTAHSLRHTCACLLLEEGVELVVIQRFLNHRNIATTQLYTRFAEFDLLDKQKPHEILSKIVIKEPPPE